MSICRNRFNDGLTSGTVPGTSLIALLVPVVVDVHSIKPSSYHIKLSGHVPQQLSLGRYRRPMAVDLSPKSFHPTITVVRLVVSCLITGHPSRSNCSDTT